MFKSRRWMSQLKKRRVYPFSTILFYSGPPSGWMPPPTLVRVDLLYIITNSNANLIQKHLHTHTQKQCFTGSLTSLSPVKSHKINHHRYLIIASIRWIALCTTGHNILTYGWMIRLGTMKLVLQPRNLGHIRTSTLTALELQMKPLHILSFLDILLGIRLMRKNNLR